MQHNSPPIVDAGPSQLQTDLRHLPPACFPVWRVRWDTLGARQREPRYLIENQHYEEGILDFKIPGGEYQASSEPCSPKCTCTRCVDLSTHERPSPLCLNTPDAEESGYIYSDLYNNSFRFPSLGSPINLVPGTIVPSPGFYLHQAPSSSASEAHYFHLAPSSPASEGPYSHPALSSSPASSASSSHIVLPNAVSPLAPYPRLASSSSSVSSSYSGPNSTPSPLSYPAPLAGSSLEWADNLIQPSATDGWVRGNLARRPGILVPAMGEGYSGVHHPQARFFHGETSDAPIDPNSSIQEYNLYDWRGYGTS